MSDTRSRTNTPPLPEPAEGEASRRDLLAGLGAAVAGLAAGLAPGEAGANSGGLGAFVGRAQAQTAPATPVGTPWWPSRWGDKDEAGASNHITPAKILEALSLVKTGKAYEIGRVYEASMPAFGERKFNLRIPGAPTGGPLGKNRVIWNDEFLATEIGQVGTQFDGLGHIGVAVQGEDKAQMRFYNGFTVSDMVSAYGLQKLGMEKVKPIISRGLLIDVVAVRGKPMEIGDEIKAGDVTAALDRQKVPADWLKPGDVVVFHTGWGRHWGKDNATFMKGEPGPGMEVGKWLIEKQVSVVGADSWGVEVVPNPDGNLAFPVHQELITKNGIFIHENLATEQLAADGVYQFCYMMLPLRIKGATGSPGRPLALI
jgi:kynurenine formamidase